MSYGCSSQPFCCLDPRLHLPSWKHPPPQHQPSLCGQKSCLLSSPPLFAPLWPCWPPKSSLGPEAWPSLSPQNAARQTLPRAQCHPPLCLDLLPGALSTSPVAPAWLFQALVCPPWAAPAPPHLKTRGFPLAADSWAGWLWLRALGCMLRGQLGPAPAGGGWPMFSVPWHHL